MVRAPRHADDDGSAEPARCVDSVGVVLSAEELRDDERVDRAVAHAFLAGAISHAQWVGYLGTRARFYRLAPDERDAARVALVSQLPVLRTVDLRADPEADVEAAPAPTAEPPRPVRPRRAVVTEPTIPQDPLW